MMMVRTLFSSVTFYAFMLRLPLQAAMASTAAAVNTRPIIGILTEEDHEKNKTFIVSSYVKFLECAGARVMPIMSSSSSEQLTSVFNSINGVLFPGGAVNLNSSFYGEAASTIFKLAKQANEQGDYFPLWGTCLGFEALGYLATDDFSILSHVDASNVCLPVNFTGAAQSSRLYSDFSAEHMKWMNEESLAFNHHVRGITTATFHSTPALYDLYTVLSTNKDKNGIEFVSSIEAKKYPFYGVQWHPEKSTFEWSSKEAINHTQHAVIAMQLFSNFFVSEARRSAHKFSSVTEEAASLIYMHTPTFTGENTNFEQAYFF